MRERAPDATCPVHDPADPLVLTGGALLAGLGVFAMLVAVACVLRSRGRGG